MCFVHTKPNVFFSLILFFAVHHWYEISFRLNFTGKFNNKCKKLMNVSHHSKWKKKEWMEKKCVKLIASIVADSNYYAKTKTNAFSISSWSFKIGNTTERATRWSHRFHFRPLHGVFDAHMISYGIWMGKTTTTL